jgi:hypothetical protein
MVGDDGLGGSGYGALILNLVRLFSHFSGYPA